MAKPTLYRDNSKPRNLLEALQTAILNRYSKPYGGNEPVVYEFTQDRALIHQYHRLLETMYRRMYDAQNFKADADVYDKLSHILIARRGRLCLGGCRLTIREPDEGWDLPLENASFALKSAFPDLPLNRVRHGELSRFAVMEDNGDRDIFYGLCKVMYEKVVSEQLYYLFAQSNYTLARNWRMIATKLGAKTTQIREDVVLPEHPLIHCGDIYITVSDLSTNFPAVESTNMGENIVAPSFEEAEIKPHLALID